MAKSKIEAFTGFTPATIQFFNDLKENNYKEWFEDNRHIYENEVLKPLKALVVALSPIMYNIDANFELRPHRAISRIYRDVRFSKNKDPYKTAMWFTFQIPISREAWMDYPGFYMELRGDGYTYGMGLFMPKKKTMDSLRDEIAYNAEEFQRVTQETVLDRNFLIEGEEYKRLLANDLPQYFQPWIQRKGIYVTKNLPIGKELFSAELVKQIADDFQSLEWLYNFMKEAAQ